MYNDRKRPLPTPDAPEPKKPSILEVDEKKCSFFSSETLVCSLDKSTEKLNALKEHFRRDSSNTIESWEESKNKHHRFTNNFSRFYPEFEQYNAVKCEETPFYIGEGPKDGDAVSRLKEFCAQMEFKCIVAIGPPEDSHRYKKYFGETITFEKFCTLIGLKLKSDEKKSTTKSKCAFYLFNGIPIINIHQWQDAKTSIETFNETDLQILLHLAQLEDKIFLHCIAGLKRSPALTIVLTVVRDFLNPEIEDKDLYNLFRLHYQNLLAERPYILKGGEFLLDSMVGLSTELIRLTGQSHLKCVDMTSTSFVMSGFQPF